MDLEPVEIPRLDAPDAIFSWSLFSLSLRQFTLFLLAAVIAVNVWTLLGLVGLGDPIRGSLEILVLALFAVLVVVFGWLRVGGQPFESYSAAYLRYHMRPRIAVWRRRGDEEVV
jgi:hypothetical protein